MGKILNKLMQTDGVVAQADIGGIVINGIPVEIDEGKNFIRMSVVCSLEFFRSVKADIEADCREKNINPPFYEGTKAFFAIKNDGAFDLVYPKVKEVIGAHLTEIKEAECPVCKRGFCDTAAFSGPYFVPVHKACIDSINEDKKEAPAALHMFIGVLIAVGTLLLNLLMLLGLDRQMSIVYMVAGVFGAIYVKSKCPNITAGLKAVFAIICTVAYIIFPYLSIGALLCNNRGMAFSEIFSRWPIVLSYTFSSDNLYMLFFVAGGIIFTWAGIFGKDKLGKNNVKKIRLPL